MWKWIFPSDLCRDRMKRGALWQKRRLLPLYRWERLGGIGKQMEMQTVLC